MRDLFRSILAIPDREERAAFADSVAKTNAQRILPVALITILLEVIMLIRAILLAPTLNDGGLIYVYMGLYAAMLLMVTLVLLMYKTFARRPGKETAAMRGIAHFVVCFGILWAAVVTVLDFHSTEQVTAFVSMQYLTGIVFLLPPVSSLIVQMSAEALFLLGLALYLPGQYDMSGVFINTAISSLMAFVISRTLYSGSLNQFRANRIIEEKNKELAELSVTDPLTRLMNRSYFDETLQREWATACRDGGALMIAMVDVDDFKRYNDIHGHLEGDNCLRSVAEAMRAVLRRPSDVLARFGGEEFILLARGADLEKDRGLLERVREAVEDLRMEHGGSRAGECVTVSVGGYGIAPTAQDSPQDAVRRADEALYAAKEAGRNRAVLF